MFRAIWWATPGIVLLAAGTFAGDPVWIGSAQTRVFDWLVTIDADMVFRSFCDAVQILAHHKLAVVPLVTGNAFVIDTLDLATISDIARLDLGHTVLLIQGKGISHLIAIMGD